MSIARAAIVVALAAGACKRPPDPTCENVWDHIVSIAPDDARASLNRDREVAACERGAMREDTRRCALAASDYAEALRCWGGGATPRAAGSPTAVAGSASTGAGSVDRPALHDVRDAIVRFGADHSLRGTTVHATGYVDAVPPQAPLSKRGRRIYPIVVVDRLGDGHPNLDCNLAEPPHDLAAGDRVRVTGVLAGDPDTNPELAQVQLDDCAVEQIGR